MDRMVEFKSKDKVPVEDPEGAAIRIDEAVRTIQEPVRQLYTTAEQHRRTIRVLTVSLVFDILLSLGLGAGLYRANVASLQAKQAQKAACESGNEFKRLDLQRWNFIINLSASNPVPNQTPAQKQQAAANLKTFQNFLSIADAPRSC